MKQYTTPPQTAKRHTGAGRETLEPQRSHGVSQHGQTRPETPGPPTGRHPRPDTNATPRQAGHTRQRDNRQTHDTQNSPNTTKTSHHDASDQGSFDYALRVPLRMTRGDLPSTPPLRMTGKELPSVSGRVWPPPPWLRPPRLRTAHRAVRLTAQRLGRQKGAATASGRIKLGRSVHLEV